MIDGEKRNHWETINVKNLVRLITYALRTRYKIICALFSIPVMAWIFQPWTGNLKVAWLDWGESLIGICTLAVAIVVWFEELKHEREEALPKKLTASFYFENWLVLRCDKAYLAAVSDIRAWSQQLGRQMINNVNLEFEPFIIQHPGEKDESKQFMLYHAEYTLTELPKAYKEKYKERLDEDITEKTFLKKAEKGKLGCIYWSHDPEIGLKKDWRPSEKVTSLLNKD